MNLRHRRFLTAILGILLLTGPGCTSNSSPLVPAPSATPSTNGLLSVAFRVSVPDGTATLDVRASVGEFVASKSVMSFSTAALRVKAVAQFSLDLPPGRAELRFTARDAAGRVLAENTTTADVSSGNAAFQVVLSPGSASPEPTPSPTPSPTPGNASPSAPGGSSPPPFLGGPSASASPGASPSASASATATPTATVAPSPTPTASPAPTPTPTATVAPSPTPTPTPRINGGVITTLAGNGTSGLTNGTGTAAQFNFPGGLGVDSSGNIYVADMFNNAIRKVTPAGAVTTLAGDGSSGYVEGTGSGAVFNLPLDVKVDASGNVIVADCNNNRVRMITQSGVTSLIAGSGGTGLVDGTGANAQIAAPQGLVIDGSGNIYVAATDNHAIRKIAPGGVVTTLAGNGSAGFLDGTGTGAQFRLPRGLAMDSSGNIYVVDTANHRIRKVTPAGVVTTLAGSGVQGSADGTGTAAQFFTPYHAVFADNGTLYVTDGDNHRIRKITAAGVVTTLAGSTQGYVDATGTGAKFNTPYGLTVDSNGALFITDFATHRLRKSL